MDALEVSAVHGDKRGLVLFGLPRFQTIIATVSAPILVGFAIADHWKGDWYAGATFWFLCITDVLATVNWFAFAYADWKDRPSEKIGGQKAVLVPVATGYKHELTTAGVKLDKVRLYNRTLIDMRNSNLDVNMTEAFWVEEKIEHESRWNRIGGSGRTDYVEMMDRGIRWGAYRQVGGQGKRVAGDWRKIRQLEQGYPLPQ